MNSVVQNPQKNPKTQKSGRVLRISLCGLFAALCAVGAFIKIPVPVCPFTLQFLFTMLAGLLLGAKNGAISVAVYVIVGLVGFPVFTAGGGPGYIFQPTFGYLLGFILATFVTGKIAHKTPDPSLKRLLVANFAGMLIVYILGCVYYYIISNYYISGNGIGVKALFLSCFLLPLPGDIFLCILSAFLGKRLIPATRKYRKE